MDTSLRELERLCTAAPDDAMAIARLAAALDRARRGWHGEPLQEHLHVAPERWVYHHTRADLSLEMVWVPPGEFVYGDGEKRTTEGFYIGRYPVTWREYARFCWKTFCEFPERPRWRKRLHHPVVNVSWHDASAFAEWAGLRLPTEEEWEKAARGTDGRTYPWGNEEPTAERCVYGRSWNEGSAAVRRGGMPARPTGASPYGAQDMAGNVWEWTSSEYEGDARVVRGGSWLGDGFILRASYRYRLDPAYLGINIGFRVVLGAPQDQATNP